MILPRRLRGAATILVAILAAVACGARTPPTVAPAPSTAAPDPSAIVPPVGDPSFDLSGTTWIATSLVGMSVPPDRPPRLEFDVRDASRGVGFTGCDEFGFEARIDEGAIEVGPFVLNPAGCSGPGADVERRFVPALGAVDAWLVDGDRLFLGGRRGQIVLERALPPTGDPGRELADALRARPWTVTAATGVGDVDLLPPVRFGDTMLIATGDCGLSGRVRFRLGGAIEITDVGWDTAGCGAADPRAALQAVLQSVTAGRPGPDGTVVLSGPAGEVVLSP